MKHIKLYSMFVMILLFCVLCSCGKGDGDLKEQLCSPNKNINELVSKIYSDSQLLEIAQQKVTLNELNKQYPVECLRKIGVSYRAAYLGKDSVAIVHFDSNGNRILGKVYSLYLTKADFMNLAVGQPLENVQVVDPQAEYLFLQTGSNSAPRVSTHYTCDGYIVTIEYDEQNAILNVTADLL